MLPDFTSITTWPGIAEGASTSLISSFSGPPSSTHCKAFIIISYICELYFLTYASISLRGLFSISANLVSDISLSVFR